MHAVLRKNHFFVKEQVGQIRAVGSYDIVDIATNQPIIHCREPEPDLLSKVFRFLNGYWCVTPFRVELRTPEGKKVLSIQRGWSLLRTEILVLDENDGLVGKLRQQIFSFKEKFDVLDNNDRTIFVLPEECKERESCLRSEDRDFARITRNSAEKGLDVATGGDHYLLSIDPSIQAEAPVRLLILASVIYADAMLKK